MLRLCSAIGDGAMGCEHQRRERRKAAAAADFELPFCGHGVGPHDGRQQQMLGALISSLPRNITVNEAGDRTSERMMEHCAYVTSQVAHELCYA
jgi:hypothetical protein